MDFDLFRHNYMILSKADDPNPIRLFETAEELAKNNIRLPQVKEVSLTWSRYLDVSNEIFAGSDSYGGYVIWTYEGQLCWTLADW